MPMMKEMMAVLSLELELFGHAGGSHWELLADVRTWAIVVTILGAAAAVLAAADLMKRDRRRCGCAARLLARTIGLTQRDLSVLDDLARRADLPSAACLMLSRGCFEHAAEGRGHSEIQRLRHLLFPEREPVDSPQ